MPSSLAGACGQAEHAQLRAGEASSNLLHVPACSAVAAASAAEVRLTGAGAVQRQLGAGGGGLGGLDRLGGLGWGAVSWIGRTLRVS